MRAQEKLIWRSPEEIVEIAFQRAPVVMMEEYAHDLQLYGGTAGFLAEEAPEVFGSSSSEDAFLLSTDNELE